VDWRLMIGGLALLPTVWVTHRTWIARIRPIFRHVRITRQRMDFYILLVVAAYMLVRHLPQQATWQTYVRRGGDAR